MKFIVSTGMKLTQGWWNKHNKEAIIPKNIQKKLIKRGEDQLLEKEKTIGTKNGCMSSVTIDGIEYSGWWEISIVEKEE